MSRFFFNHTKLCIKDICAIRFICERTNPFTLKGFSFFTQMMQMAQMVNEVYSDRRTDPTILYFSKCPPKDVVYV